MIDYIEYPSGSFDMFRYSISLQQYDNKKRKLESVVSSRSTKKRFSTRKLYRRRDPKSSIWWIDYVVDEHHTFRDPTHRGSKLFRFRCSHSFDSVHEVVAKIQGKEHYYWRNKTDNRGKTSSPIELLVLGSLRILTRNVTLDDLRE